MGVNTLLVLTLVATLATSDAAAQDAGEPAASRTAGEDEAEGAAGLAEKAKDWIERHQIIGRLTGEVDGWYPRIGGMTRGGGFAAGPGYRTRSGSVLIDLSAALSTRVYKAADVEVRWFTAWRDRFAFWTRYRVEDFPQEDFFGTGRDSRLERRTSYDFNNSQVTASGIVDARPWLRTGVEVGLMSPAVGPGTDRDYPPTNVVFADSAAPGLDVQPDFLRATVFAAIDYRDEPGRPRRGGLYRAAFGVWDDRTLQQYDFRRLDVTVTQYVPLDARASHVVMARTGMTFANNEPGHRVPFYFLPYVGGVDTVRSFREFRFQDENAVWMTAEYNYSPRGYMTLAAFVDAGTVSRHYQEIGCGHLKRAYGVGVRVHTRRQTFARLDVATGGGEGWQVFLKLGPSF